MPECEEQYEFWYYHPDTKVFTQSVLKAEYGSDLYMIVDDDFILVE